MSDAARNPSLTTQAAERPEIAIQALGVGRRFGRVRALEGLSFELPARETLLVVGRNGSGKSTLLRMILGLERPDRGELRVFGRPPHAAGPSNRSRTGVLLHDDAVYSRLTVAETVDLWRGISGSRRFTEELLAAVGLGDAAGRPVAELSAGMRKRLALTRTLMIEPQLVVWDEPLASLDAEGRALVVGLVERLKRDAVSIVVASHERGVFAPVVDRVLDLDTGTADTELRKGSS